METREVRFWSEGTQLAGDLYLPEEDAAGRKHAAIVLCHGWGGTKAHLRALGLPQALANAGYVVLTFDYRGWGESDSKVVVLDALPKERTEASARVRVIREVVDPYDEAWDIRHALDFVEGEPMVDRQRIGLWGSSYGGGLVTWMAAHDQRVTCVVSQAASQDSRGFDRKSSRGVPRPREEMHRLGIAQARGEAEPVPQAIDAMPGLNGTPHTAKMYYFAPIEFAEQISVPVLFIDAENEELFDRHEHSEAFYRRMAAAGRTKARYEVIPGITHYGVYDEKADVTARLALEWFDEHLRPRAH